MTADVLVADEPTDEPTEDGKDKMSRPRCPRPKLPRSSRTVPARPFFSDEE